MANRLANHTIVNTADLESLTDIKGDAGQDGQGIPSGGTTGQVIKKASGTDFDTEWAVAAEGGSVSGLEPNLLVLGGPEGELSQVTGISWDPAYKYNRIR